MSAVLATAKAQLTAGLKNGLLPEVVDRFVGGTHTQRFADNLLPSFTGEQVAVFRAQLAAGSGGELRPTRTGRRPAHAPYSSAALAINAFGAWLGSEPELSLAGLKGFDRRLQLEAQLQIGHGGGLANLDVLLAGPDLVVGVESKLTETLSPHDPTPWKEAYRKDEMGSLLDDTWRALLDSSLSGQWHPTHLGLEQLIKHALALRSQRDDAKRHLVYCYWEPVNGEQLPEVLMHRAEVTRCTAALPDADPAFHAVSYSQLFSEWESLPAPNWTGAHVRLLKDRYEVAI